MFYMRLRELIWKDFQIESIINTVGRQEGTTDQSPFTTLQESLTFGYILLQIQCGSVQTPIIQPFNHSLQEITGKRQKGTFLALKLFSSLLYLPSIFTVNPTTHTQQPPKHIPNQKYWWVLDHSCKIQGNFLPVRSSPYRSSRSSPYRLLWLYEQLYFTIHQAIRRAVLASAIHIAGQTSITKTKDRSDCNLTFEPVSTRLHEHITSATGPPQRCLSSLNSGRYVTLRYVTLTIQAARSSVRSASPEPPENAEGE